MSSPFQAICRLAALSKHTLNVAHQHHVGQGECPYPTHAALKPCKDDHDFNTLHAEQDHKRGQEPAVCLESIHPLFGPSLSLEPGS